jgi:hypothetical protein
VNRARDALRFLVELQGIEPPIWRELLVPARYTFWDLHVAIQDGMGWDDRHLHEFRVPGPTGDAELALGIPDDDGFDVGYEVLPGWEYTVADYVNEAGATMRYDYDFGDDWRHTVTLLEVTPRDKGTRYPRCIAGERACPPEDCGGPAGYRHLLEALLDPGHPEHEFITDWLPPGWAPGVFEPSTVRFQDPKARWRRAFIE